MWGAPAIREPLMAAAVGADSEAGGCVLVSPLHGGWASLCAAALRMGHPRLLVGVVDCDGEAAARQLPSAAEESAVPAEGAPFTPLVKLLQSEVTGLVSACAELGRSMQGTAGDSTAPSPSPSDLLPAHTSLLATTLSLLCPYPALRQAAAKQLSTPNHLANLLQPPAVGGTPSPARPPQPLVVGLAASMLAGAVALGLFSQGSPELEVGLMPLIAVAGTRDIHAAHAPATPGEGSGAVGVSGYPSLQTSGCLLAAAVAQLCCVSPRWAGGGGRSKGRVNPRLLVHL